MRTRILVSSLTLSRFGDEARADSADLVDTFWTESCKEPPSTSEKKHKAALLAVAVAARVHTLVEYASGGSQTSLKTSDIRYERIVGNSKTSDTCSSVGITQLNPRLDNIATS